MDKVKVRINNNQKVVKIPTGLRLLIRRCCNAVLKLEDFKGDAEVNVTFVDNQQITKLNKLHMNKNSATDVLSFPMGENGNYDIDPQTNAKILGDIVLSMEKVISQAEDYGHSLKREAAYLTSHSMFHLLGYDHEDRLEKIRMREKEELIMSQLGLPSTSTYVLN